MHKYSSRMGNILSDGIANGMSETTQLCMCDEASVALMGSNVVGGVRLGRARTHEQCAARMVECTDSVITLCDRGAGVPLQAWTPRT